MESYRYNYFFGRQVNTSDNPLRTLVRSRHLVRISPRNDARTESTRGVSGCKKLLLNMAGGTTGARM